MKYFIQFILLFLCVSLYAQEPEVKRERTFTASGLYGFMNGGADQFLEYGVQKLVVREIIYKDEEYTIEIYEMPSPEDAFGIYSLHTFKCLRADTSGCLDCLSPYQLQAVSGNEYISVVFSSGSESAKAEVDQVLRKYVSMDSKIDFIPALLNMKPPYSGNLKYIKGSLSASTAGFSFAKIVEGIPYKGIWFVSKKPAKDYRALIYLTDTKDIDKVRERILPADIISVGEDYIYILGKEEEKEDDFGTFGF